MYLHTIALLESVGFQFGLDFDDELIVEYPLEFDPKVLADKVATDHAKETVQFLKARAMRQRQQFIGGPLNGQQHEGLPWLAIQIGENPLRLANYGFLARCLGPAEWAVYIGNPADGRAFYHGTATSQKKARRRAFEIMTARGRLEKVE